MGIKDDSAAGFVAVTQTQAAMADTLSKQSEILADISKTLVTIQVDQGRAEERMLSLLEDNHQSHSRMSGHESRLRSLEQITNVNKFAVKFAPRMFYSLMGALGLGCAVTYKVMEMMNK